MIDDLGSIWMIEIVDEQLYYISMLLAGLRKIRKILSLDSPCPGRDIQSSKFLKKSLERYWDANIRGVFRSRYESRQILVSLYRNTRRHIGVDSNLTVTDC
jgi:hypothetical protein